MNLTWHLVPRTYSIWMWSALHHVTWTDVYIMAKTMLLLIAENLYFEVCVNSGLWIRSCWILEQQKWTQEHCVVCTESHPQTGISKRPSWEILTSHFTLEIDGFGLRACVCLSLVICHTWNPCCSVLQFLVLHSLVLDWMIIKMACCPCNPLKFTACPILLCFVAALMTVTFQLSDWNELKIKKVDRSEWATYDLHCLCRSFSFCDRSCCWYSK